MRLKPSYFIEQLQLILQDAFSQINLKTFFQTYQEDLDTSFEGLKPNDGNFVDHISAILTHLKNKRRIGQFIELLVKKKGQPEMVELQKKWNKIFEKDSANLDQFKQESFDLFFFSDNNEKLPFIGREDFKNDIRQVINTPVGGNLRLFVNGTKGVGVSYLRQYLTQLDIHFDCLQNYMIIDCQEDLLKEQHDEIHPVHIAESLLSKLGINQLPTYIDLEDPLKFKEMYYPRFFDAIKEECESKKEGVVLFIDHLHHKMPEEIFRFLDKFLKKLQEFRITYVLILAGLTTSQYTFSVATTERTLEQFKKEDLSNYFKKIYLDLKYRFPAVFEKVGDTVFITAALESIDAAMAEEEIHEEQLTMKVQKAVKFWYETTLDEIKNPTQ